MRQLEYKKISIAFSEKGKGNAVLLLHGFLENKSMWDNYIPILAKNHRVIVVDLLGHGQTACIGYVHSMEDQADMLHSLVQHLRIRKVTLIGHSMGGYISLAFAEMYPDHVKGIVLLNSTSRADSDEKKTNRDRAITAVKQNYSNFVRMSIANLFNEDNKEKLKNEIEKVKIEALKTPLQGIVAALEGMKIRKDREVLLHFAPYPIQLILGQKDTVLPYDETIDQVEGTKVDVVNFPDGHMTTVENEKELLKVLGVFLKKI